MVDIQKIKAGLKSHHAEGKHCKGCPYDHSDSMLDPRIDPSYGRNVIETVKKCRDELLADCMEYIENLEERIAIMTESQDDGKEIPFCYDDVPDEPSEDDEYV